MCDHSLFQDPLAYRSPLLYHSAFSHLGIRDKVPRQSDCLSPPCSASRDYVSVLRGHHDCDPCHVTCVSHASLFASRNHGSGLLTMTGILGFSMMHASFFLGCSMQCDGVRWDSVVRIGIPEYFCCLTHCLWCVAGFTPEAGVWSSLFGGRLGRKAKRCPLCDSVESAIERYSEGEEAIMLQRFTLTAD